MGGVCGIVSEKVKPESHYWRKMCEYVTKSKSVSSGGCYASSENGYYYKEIAGHGCFAIVDGTIHNYNAVRRNLYLKGVVVETCNAAELVLLCYMYLGERCFKVFKGEFCAVIWNGCESELILLRDKIGLNTIFYYIDGLRLVFCSDISGILKFPFARGELCEDVFCKLFALSGGAFQGETLFSRIYEVPPGSYVRYKNLKTEVKSYHTFLINEISDDFSQTVSAFEFLCKNYPDTVAMTEKVMAKQQLNENIEKFVKNSGFPSPYIDLKTLSNSGSDESFTDLMGIFNVPERFILPSATCKKQDREFVNGFLSTLPWFEHKDEKDIAKKEEVYIKQYIVLPKVVYARKKACKNIKFPYLTDEITELSLNSLKYAKKLSREFSGTQYRGNKENIKNLKALFWQMTEGENLMCGLIDKEELLKFTRLFPRPETMLYLLQVDVWLNMFL